MEQGEAISVEECWRLLGTADVGRLALSVDALPAVLPVSYAVDGREVTMCLGELRVPERAAHGAIVALEVDELGPGDRAGWFVHAVGMVRLASGPPGGPAGDDGPPGSAAGDDGPPGWLVARLAPTIVYGRRVHLHAPPSAGG